MQACVQEMEVLDKYVEGALARVSRGHDILGRLDRLGKDKPRVLQSPACKG